MSIDRSGIVCGALITGATLLSGYLLVRQHWLQPNEIFSLSSPTGQTFPVNVKLLDGSVVPVPGCFSEMSVAELRKRVAVALQTPPGRVSLQLDGLPVDRDLTLGGAGITAESTLDFRTSLLGGIRPSEAALLRTYTQLLRP